MPNHLPEKGSKRVKAILQLGQDEAHGLALLNLIATEKGQYKTAAYKALSQLSCPQAAPLWQKLVKGKYMGTPILQDSCSECVSESIAPIILDQLSALLEISQRQALNHSQYEQLRFCFALMLGKDSEQMLDVYRYLADHLKLISSLKHQKEFDNDKCQTFRISDDLMIYKSSARELTKIPAIILTCSIIKNPSEALINLSCQLAKTHDSFLTPLFMSEIITKKPDYVFDTYAPLLDTPKAIYLLNALGMLDYQYYPPNWPYYRSGPNGMQALLFWGNYSYGKYDTRTVFSRYIEFDSRWYEKLAINPLERKPKVCWQQYNRSGVLYESFDEMLLSILPVKLDDLKLKRQLYHYFQVRSEHHLVAKSITLYQDALTRFALNEDNLCTR